MRTLILTAAFALATLGSAQAAAPCKDAKGKFMKCPAPAAAAAPAGKCRDMKTKKFAKCGAPGTEAVPMKK
jgi:hypothetical protein